MKRRAVLPVAWVSVSAVLAPAPCLAELGAVPKAEIEALLKAVGSSQCEFMRGGTWHDARRAETHLGKKFEYLAAKNQLASAEEFIAKAATRSAMMGQAYAIRCGSAAPQQSDVWLHHRLDALRKGAKPAPH